MPHTRLPDDVSAQQRAAVRQLPLRHERAAADFMPVRIDGQNAFDFGIRLFQRRQEGLNGVRRELPHGGTVPALDRLAESCSPLGMGSVIRVVVDVAGENRVGIIGGHDQGPVGIGAVRDASMLVVVQKVRI